MITYIKDTRIHHRKHRIVLQLVIFTGVILGGWVVSYPRTIPAPPVNPRTGALRFSAQGEREGGPHARLKPHGEERSIKTLDTSELLNLALYELLCELADSDVNVVNKGQELRYAVVERNGRRGIRVASGGEEYVIDCPICGDTRKRCHVNHTFGTRIEGIPVYHLVHCFNEECDSKVSKWLREAMKDSGMDGKIAIKAKKADPTFDPMQMAQTSAQQYAKLYGVMPLTALTIGHDALRYVAERGFDAAYLANHFKVGFFKGHPKRRSWADKRMIIPMFFSGMQVGWTARLIPEYTPRPWPSPVAPPKYYTAPGFKRSWFIYNYDNAKDSRVIAVAEGVTDVWKIGLWGMALLGKSMSDQQCQLLCQAGEETGAWIVLLGDASTEKDDAATSWKRNYAKLVQNYKHPERVRLYLFEKGDPGDYTSQEISDIVMRVLHTHNAV